jgi:hypothetical protein
VVIIVGTTFNADQRAKKSGGKNQEIVGAKVLSKLFYLQTIGTACTVAHAV